MTYWTGSVAVEPRTPPAERPEVVFPIPFTQRQIAFRGWPAVVVLVVLVFGIAFAGRGVFA